MNLLDANIFIYAPQPAFAHLRPMLIATDSFASEITRLEVLGFHRLSVQEQDYYRTVFSHLLCLPITTLILNRAISFRQQRKMSLGDSIVAATALEHGLILQMRKVKDFAGISGLTVQNPVDV